VPEVLSLPHLVGEDPHAFENFVDISDDVLSVDLELLVLWQTKRGMENRASLRKIDLGAFEHRIARLGQSPGPRQLEQKAHRALIYEVLRVVQEDPGATCAELRRSPLIGREQIAKADAV
jgi:hypothetical protein